MQGKGVRGEDSEKNRLQAVFFISPPHPLPHHFLHFSSFLAVKNENHTKKPPAMQPTYNQIYEIFTSIIVLTNVHLTCY